MRPDPAQPHRVWWADRLLLLVWLAAALAGVFVWTAFAEDRWPPLVGALLAALSAVAAHDGRRRWSSSPGAGRDAARVAGSALLALVLLLGAVPFVVP